MQVQEMPDRYSQLNACIEESFATTKYSDLAIHCGGRVWHVHRVVVCGQSPFFKKACSSGFMESTTKTINLEEDDPAAVHRMLQYFYTGDYCDSSDESGGNASCNTFIMDAHMHTIADKYDIPALAELAINRFTTRATNEWNTPAFSTAIEKIYAEDTGTEEEIRKSAVTVAAKYAKVLFKKESGADFRRVVKTVPSFAAALAVTMLECTSDDEGVKRGQGEVHVRYHCPNRQCGRPVEMAASTWDSGATYASCPHCRNFNFKSKWVRRDTS